MTIKWTLNNVKFSDGGEATGFFVIGNGSTYVRINTTAGSEMLSAFYRKYEQVNLGFSEYTISGGTLSGRWGATGFGERALWLNTAVDLSMYTSGTFAIVPGPSARGPYDRLCSQETHTYITFVDEDESAKSSTLYRTVLPGGTITAKVVEE